MRHFKYLIWSFWLSAALVSCSSSSKNATSTGSTIPGYNAELSRKLGVPVPASANVKLVEEVLSWKGTPYKYGGNSKTGVDCSGFISRVYQVVFDFQTPRTTADIQKIAKPVPAVDIKEGDIVFFTITGNNPNHSGIYLWDGYFAHSSTGKGVIVSNLSESYWSKYFTGAGRFLLTRP